MIARKQLEELQQPGEKEPTCEERMGNPKIVESTEESKEKFRARYPDGVTVISVDDLKKSILLCDKGIYSVEEKEDEKDVVKINGKSVKDLLAENEMLHKMGVFKHYAKGGVTTKEEVTELKRSKKNK